MDKDTIKKAFQIGYSDGVKQAARRLVREAYVAPPPPKPTQGFAGRHRDTTGHALRGDPPLRRRDIPNPWAERRQAPTGPMQRNRVRCESVGSKCK